MTRTMFARRPWALMRVLLVIACFAGVAERAHSACTAPSYHEVPLGHLVIPPGASPGMLLKTVTMPEITITCPPREVHDFYIELRLLFAEQAPGPSWTTFLFQQLGIRIRDLVTNREFTPEKQLIHAGITNGDPVRMQLQYEIYYTGLPQKYPDTPTNPARMIELLRGSVWMCWPGTNCTGDMMWVGPGTDVTVDMTTCVLEDAAVTLSPVQPSDLASPGDFAEQKPITVKMTCGPGISRSARFTIDDAARNANRSNEGLLTLAPDSEAAGVTIQLLRNGEPVSLGSTWNEAVMGESNSEIRFDARYYRLDAPLQSGSVHALATLTVTYL